MSEESSSFSTSQVLKLFDQVMTGTFSGLSLLFILYILLKLNRSLNFPCILVLSLYALAAVMRCLKLFLGSEYLNTQASSIINSIALSCLLFSLQYFVFIVREYRAKIECRDHLMLSIEIQRIHRIKYIVLTIQALTAIAKSYIEFIEPDPFNNHGPELNRAV
jgi:hypothetical protein